MRKRLNNNAACFLKLAVLVLVISPHCIGGLISAYKNNSCKKTIVALNNSDGIDRQKINVSDVLTGVFVPYATTTDKNAAQESSITASNNSFTY